MKVVGTDISLIMKVISKLCKFLLFNSTSAPQEAMIVKRKTANILVNIAESHYLSLESHYMDLCSLLTSLFPQLGPVEQDAVVEFLVITNETYIK